ncbi:large ribosomal subunit protein mL54-like [Styela clava]
MFYRGLLVSRRNICCTVINNAKKAAKKAPEPTSAPKMPEVVRDTQLLQKYCCGLGFKVDEEDPELKPDSEYPEWLWSIHTGPPKTYKDYDPNTREYWYALEEAQKEHSEKIKGEKSFYRPPRDTELNFRSRLPKKKFVTK